MNAFNCLAPDCPLFGPHFLEASAGTGKTFAMEQVFTRLLMEAPPDEEPLQLEQILAVTFTRAATRELKNRIRANLLKASLEESLARFDRCQIFTIHSFCFRALQEFAFEAGLPVGIALPDSEEMPEVIERALKDFFEGALPPTISAEQMAALLKRRNFDKLTAQLYPLPQILSPDPVLRELQTAWLAYVKPLYIAPLNSDDLLTLMRDALQRPAFLQAVQTKYRAALIDEFQDTDPIQWEIFRTLFLGRPMRALYLVGDPKQSIYRFRRADLYTYLEARDAFPAEALYCLDTNYRSTPSLINALNELFNHDWLRLPKVNRTLSYIPLQAGCPQEWDPGDGVGPIHFFDKDPNLTTVVNEINRLRPLFPCYDAFAILVKDRFELEQTVAALQAAKIPASAKSRRSIADTPAFHAWRELFGALASPNSSGWTTLLAQGPFRHSSLPALSRLFEERGLLPLLHRLFEEGFWKEAVAQKGSFAADSAQMVEEILHWTATHTFSLPALEHHLDNLSENRRLAVGEDAVQIMTIHVSKGLEFEVVFACGLATEASLTEEEPEEAHAETLRQLYVAMTRAKKRLYVPRPSTPNAPIGRFLKQTPPSIELPAPTTNTIATPEPSFTSPEPIHFRQPIIQVHSFTSLAQEESIPIPKLIGPAPEELPAGPETGLTMHRILERLFRSRQPLWQEDSAIERITGEELRDSPLMPWTQEIFRMTREALQLPLIDQFSLSQLEVGEVQPEVEFLFARTADWVKGTIDLIFCYNGAHYFVDWKSNWLESYTQPNLQKAMEQHQYLLQADLYSQSLRRHLPNLQGAFYIFLRGPGVYRWS